MPLLIAKAPRIVVAFGVVIVIAAALLYTRQTIGHLEKRFAASLAACALPTAPAVTTVITVEALASLPEPVRRYLAFMGVVGRPPDWSLRVRFHGRFRLDRGDWLPCDAVQYDSAVAVARLFSLRVAMKGVLPVLVSDTYVSGRGHMLARAFDLVTVVDATGNELDVGELVTYLNDAILLAPSMLLGPRTTWSAVLTDPSAFDVVFNDSGRSVTARVHLDERGAPTDFVTTDRFFVPPSGSRIRAEWRTPVEGYQLVGGRQLPTRAQAVWMLAEGPFPYADLRFEPELIEFNVTP